MGIHQQLIENYRFRVWIDNHKVSFSKVSGLSMSVETEMISEGGYNEYAHIVEAPAKSSKILRLERGVYTDNNSILRKLRPGMYLKQGVVIAVIGGNGKTVIKYAAENAFVTKWEIADLDAQNGQMLIDTFEIAYTELKIMK